MAILEFLLGQRKAKIGLVTLDASLNETHDKTNEVTQHPVEDGVVISDHIRRTPEKLKINGVITNHPIVFFASIAAPSPVSSDAATIEDRAERADREFRRAMDAGELVEVFTTLRSYKNMAIVGYSVIREKGSGSILNFNIELQELVKVVTERVAAPVPVTDNNQKVEDLGRKQPVPADDATAGKTSDTILKSFKDGVVNFVRGGGG